MRDTGQRKVLLALDAGVRETGWAVFSPGAEVTTGVIGIPGRREMNVPGRLSHLTQGLDRLLECWCVSAVVHSEPSGIHWQVPALEQLDSALQEWSQRHRLRLFGYSAQAVRTALTGHPNATREDLAYAVMSGLELIGRSKTTHEWEAIGVGHYHLTRKRGSTERLASGDSPDPLYT